jgi:hypothetical protein
MSADVVTRLVLRWPEVVLLTGVVVLSVVWAVPETLLVGTLGLLAAVVVPGREEV